MSQTRFSLTRISPEKKKNFDKLLEKIYQDIRKRFKNYGKFQDILVYSLDYHSEDLKDEQSPEEFVKRFIVEPIISFLGYEIVSETVLPAPTGKKEPDYTIRPKNSNDPIFYVEVEPLNTDLYDKDRGTSQVKEWLLSRASKTDYGIATDGLNWILLKFDAVSVQSKEILKVDLRPVFRKIDYPNAFYSQNEIDEAKDSLLTLDCEQVSLFLENYLEAIEKQKEEISKQFYNDYVKYVFGFDEKGDSTQSTCLRSSIIVPSGVTGNSSNLFAVVFMNRVVFIKFLEEKGIVPKNLLVSLLRRYKASGSPWTFYETYLKPLFYEVFNRGKDSRISSVKMDPIYSQIPYLNGGLFREVIEQEKNYNITNEGVELVIDKLLEKYRFGLESGIDPDILGYIFEKTINFISGTGTNRQKMEGAYYTPDDVVEFIIEETLMPIIFRKMIEGLKKSGWSDTDLKGYNSIEDILNPANMPKNPMHIRNMIRSIETIRVLDPACGSGHFLTTVLSQILRVKESLLRIVDENVDRYRLKRDIVSQNLFGVDFDENAVEIARLRLWLSIIEEVKDSEHIDTLPNIDFNIFVGNSLIGWKDENLLIHPLVSLLDDSYVEGTLDALSVFYGSRITEVKHLLTRMRLEDTISAYKMLLELYTLESGERAVKIRELLEKIRNRLYDVINDSFLAYIHEKTNFNKNGFEKLAKNFTGRKPFHWKVDFEGNISEGGFDVVVGNPPYVEDKNYNEFDLEIIRSVQKVNNKNGAKPLFYHSKDCGNTHAYFTERSINLLASNGRFGFIVPISIVSTDRMSGIRKFIHDNSSEVKYYNFDDRPGKIFSGLEHCRSTIVIAEKGNGVKEITTSKYHRWYTKDRAGLFQSLKTVRYDFKDSKAIVPKIGTIIEKKILEKMMKKSGNATIKDFLRDKGAKIWYHNSPQYWVHAHTDETVPMVEYFDKYETDPKTGKKTLSNLKEKRVTDQYKPLVLSPNNSLIVNGLLNTSLFYWWYTVWSDGRHLLAQHINNFPIKLDDFPKTLTKKLTTLVNDLMKSYYENSNEKINLRSGGYAIRIREIISVKSKDIIDKIDDIFAEYYGFTDEERQFINEFDMKFRM